MRLRGDAFAQAPSPVGLVVLRGEDRRTPWIDAETVTWLGARPTASLNEGSREVTGDVLTLSVRMRDVASGSEVRAGRLLVTMGAVRPLHLDGARGLARLPTSTVAEAFAGVPVVPRFGWTSFDWAAGGRVAQVVRDVFVIGGAYQQRRSSGRPADEEVGLDAAFTPSARVTAAARASFDLLSYGITDALASVSTQTTPAMREGSVRVEAFTTHRSPGRLLPSTSLFSVLGDFASTTTGATVRWKAFPRLDLVGTGGAQVQGSEWGGQGTGRAVLALDDDGDAHVALEVRRVDIRDARWNGVRGVAYFSLTPNVRLGAELELVRPEPRSNDTRDRDAVWPWALGSVAWRVASAWDLAAAVEASSGPDGTRRTLALVRASWAWGSERGAR